MKKQPVLITDAARSQADQIHSREVRYVTMMGIRAACLIIGAILLSVRPPLLGLWLVLCLLGMVFLPWAAVLIANDRPAKTKAERAAAHTQRPQRALDQHTAEEVDYLIIDVEPPDTEPTGTDSSHPEPQGTEGGDAGEPRIPSQPEHKRR